MMNIKFGKAWLVSCCLVFVAYTASAQVYLNGPWQLKDATHHISLFFRDDHVVSIVINKTQTGTDKALTKMGLFSISGKEIKVRWSAFESDTWTIKKITAKALKLSIRIKRREIQINDLTFEHTPKDDRIVDPL